MAMGAQTPCNPKALRIETVLPCLKGAVTTARSPLGARAWLVLSKECSREVGVRAGSLTISVDTGRVLS
jgi:hypothetical protein